jgi:hypothetical protein
MCTSGHVAPIPAPMLKINLRSAFEVLYPPDKIEAPVSTVLHPSYPMKGIGQ